ncbi:hypothetical protein AK812_SmicGene25741 [Symbiodinium microadriaticum]|uniref:Uncharacterized protein n=1 Tax=Symbiodinium microadriaticum TaxID=2951 RepID=A0A1Q9DBB8_SYMMI|nr:hypothetical protein AK812_SmicGene25741 [Symbiodinium microadriaticum]
MIPLFQSTASPSAVISLESGSGTIYTNVSRFSQLSGGSWEHLARWEVADKTLGSMWRLVPTGVAPEAWRIIEIEIFSAENCSSPLAFQTFSSGGLGMALAGDGDLTSAWQEGRVRAFSPVMQV